jgi:heme exporter protein D
MVFCVITLALGITCAVREGMYKNYSNLSNYINRGAFGSCSFFAFAVTLLYIISSIIRYLDVRNHSNTSSRNQQQDTNRNDNTNKNNDQNNNNNPNLQKI